MDIKKVKEIVNDVSPSFCVAKWKQVTIHLQNGHTHSCHHPQTHKVPLQELKNNPSALHNTEYKKIFRKQMLEGERPYECDYCWRIEDSNAEYYSDRIYKSSDPEWALPYIDEIKSKDWNENIDPSYVEVSFGNTCNFKCSYCNPTVSSQWMEEIQRYGAYPTSTKFNNLEYFTAAEQIPIPNNQDNPYVDAFWEWFPSMYKNLKYFRITGGEPLLNKNTFKVLDYIIENPNENLEVSINTNMNPPLEVFNKFLDKIKIIVNENKLKRFKLFTSAEGYGKCAEYIRFGMNYEDWINNLHKTYEEVPNIQFTIMSTYNFLSLTSYENFLKDVLNIKQKYGTETYSPILLDIPYLRHPVHQSLFVAEPDHLKMIESHIKFMVANTNNTHNSFIESETNKLQRIYSMIKQHIEQNLDYDIHKKDFIRFVDEHDSRRGTVFLQTFPELTDTYYKWKNIL